MKGAFFLNTFAACIAIAAQSLNAAAEPAFQTPAEPPDVKLKEPARLENPDSFSMILFGDPQTYMKFTFSQPIFELMTAWVAAHKEVLNIKAALCTGDLVERNDLLTKFDHGKKYVNGNTPSMDMWRKVARAFGRLDGVMPYILATGNHDYGYVSSENRNTKFPEYFPILKNSCWQNCLVSTAPNAAGIMSLENAAYEFNEKNWGKILVISLEFAPRDCVLEWADKLAKHEKFKDHKVIILTHSILNTKEKSVQIIEKEGYKLPDPNWGAAVMQKLAFNSDNVKLVLCGHSGCVKRFMSNITYKNAKEREIPIVMFNPQCCGGWQGNGGDGWLRIMEFMPDGKTISMRTYSPLFGASETTQGFAWKKDAEAQFKLEIQ